MPKNKSLDPSSRQRAVRAPRPGERARRRKDAAPSEDKTASASAENRSDHELLRAEVVRLEAELLAMRARVRELELRADVDPLTEVFNRRGFERELARAVAHRTRYGGSIALIYLDLDGFKSINDRHGHAAGDAVLRGIAALLRANLRASDVVARLGGDEFVAMLWNVAESDALTKATALEHAVAAHAVFWDSNTLVVEVSAGVAVLSRAEEPACVLARADAAMYARKATRQVVSR